jgi:NADH-quinone oxidoreductase subunit L
MLDLAALIPALPLAGFLLLAFFGKRIGDPLAGWIATAAAAGSFAATLIVFAGLIGEDNRSHTQTLWEWMPVGGLQIDVGLLIDPLSITMALFVTGIGSLIHLYSIGYMHGDGGFPRFFTYLNLFLFSMLVLVLADNYILTFLGWEGVGACSYLLISFWFTRNSAAVAGKKAFVTNRIGDFGFMVASFLLFSSIGTLTYTEVAERVDGGLLAGGTATAVALLFFVGAAGKSAQLPLYVWLPDAMEGPTPVSALIHAATMVTAGVFLLVRSAPILFLGDDALTVIAIVGGLTALFAATVAVAQDDIKRVLAYSTVSQLGYMVLAVGAGAYVAAIFHMVTHAFFKALLFLGSGSVIHGLHDEQDMKRMGGLAKWMPITWGTFMIGWLAISGVPPFAGFWSKDEILFSVWAKSPVLWAMGILTALLTAYYMSRQVFLVFYGEERWRKGHRPEVTSPKGKQDDGVVGTEETEHAPHDGDHPASPHESPWTMWVPLAVLALLSLLGGALNLPFGDDFHFLGNWLDPVVGKYGSHGEESGVLQLVLALLAAAGAVAGILVARQFWLKRSIEQNASLEPEVLRQAWGVDRAYAAFMGGPARLAAAWSAFFLDKKVIDGAVNGVASGVRLGGSNLRRLQTGYVRNYALGLAGGVVVLLAYAAVRAGL